MYLYHGSANKNLTKLIPQKITIRIKGDPAYVFATNSMELALTHMLRSDDSWVGSGRINKVHYIIISDKKRFVRSDTGGAIYKFLDDGFIVTDPTHPSEYTSTISVKPISKTTYSNCLDALLDNSVQVFFVNKDTYQKYLDSEEPYYIIKELTSENFINSRNFIKII